MLKAQLLKYAEGNSDLKNIVIETIIPSNIQIKISELSHKPISILQTDTKNEREVQEKNTQVLLHHNKCT